LELRDAAELALTIAVFLSATVSTFRLIAEGF
jgi:hypothetical protein